MTFLNTTCISAQEAGTFQDSQTVSRKAVEDHPASDSFATTGQQEESQKTVTQPTSNFNFNNDVMEALANDDLDKLKLLAAQRQNFNFLTEKGWTPLTYAAEQGNAAAILLLLEAGADPDFRDGQEWTALMRASKNGFEPVVSALLAAGANMELTEPSHSTAFDIAKSREHDGVVRLLQAVIKNSPTRQNGQRSGLEAAQEKVLSLDEALILAAKAGDRIRVNELLEKGANVNTRDKGGNTPLIWAAYKGYKELVEDLVKKYHADVNAVNSRNTAALRYASQEGWEEIVSTLLDAGADVNLVDQEGTTALIWAAFKGHVNVVRKLVGKADLQLMTKEGKTALDFALQEGHQEIVNLLRDARTE